MSRPSQTTPVILTILLVTLAMGQASGQTILPTVPAPESATPAARHGGPAAAELVDEPSTPPPGRAGDAPVAIADAYVVAADDILTVSAENGLLFNDFDPEGDPLLVTSYVVPDHGTLVVLVDGSFTYTPEPSYTGEDGFRYTISDGTSISALGEVTLTVLAADNRAPTVVDDHYAVPAGETLTVPAASGLLSNDIDADEDPLFVTSYQAPANGDLTMDTAGAITYTPDPGFEGTESVSYFVSDSVELASGELVIMVTAPVNRAPTPAADWYYTPAGTVLEVDAAGGILRNDRDPDGDGIFATSYFPPANGTFLLSVAGEFNFTPDADFEGTDVIGYNIADDRGTPGTVTAELHIIVGIYGGIATGVLTPPRPGGFGLEAASPNPFNPRTELAFRTEEPGHVELRVLDMRGRLVATLVDESRPAGEHLAIWDGRTDTGGRASSGTYVAELRGLGKRSVQKLTLVK